MRIAVIGKDKYLYQKIRLSLDECDVIFSDGGSESGYDAVIFDLDSMSAPAPSGAITVSRSGAARLSIPFSERELRHTVFGSGKGKMKLIQENKTVSLGGKIIRLTELEFELLSALYEKCGAYATRRELVKSVWNDEASDGIVNVYIHYLREKLEADGERIIFSSRKEGYRLSEKVFGGE